jgi:hypothetical protein
VTGFSDGGEKPGEEVALVPGSNEPREGHDDRATSSRKGERIRPRTAAAATCAGRPAFEWPRSRQPRSG